MFQVMTGDSWSEGVARPLLHGPDLLLNLATGVYFTSYQLLCAIILINVVVAVLLQKMCEEQGAPPALLGEEDEGASSQSSLQHSSTRGRHARAMLMLGPMPADSVQVWCPARRKGHTASWIGE